MRFAEFVEKLGVMLLGVVLDANNSFVERNGSGANRRCDLDAKGVELLSRFDAVVQCDRCFVVGTNQRDRLVFVLEAGGGSVDAPGERRADLGGARPKAHARAHDDPRLGAQVVQDHQRAREHEQGIGNVHRARRSVRQPLDAAHHVVAEVPHGSAPEVADLGYVRWRPPLQQRFQVRQWVGRPPSAVPPVASRPILHRPVA